MPYLYIQRIKNLSERLVKFIYSNNLAMYLIAEWADISPSTVSRTRYRLSWPNWETTYKLNRLLTANGF
jgi:hypothetical protein